MARGDPTVKIVVQKYGGSSVADVARIRRVAQRVVERHRTGIGMVVVVSAMGDTTDDLLALATQVSSDPPRRELDMLLTCGERISMAILSMAIQELGVPAISFTGSQAGILTNEDHSQARILEVRPSRIQEELAKGRVVVVAGYQGVSREHEVTTLGRGGSDTTAVALAAALAAEACEIYSDVDGIYSADPRVVPDARKLEELSLDEMQALASAGAKVLNAQAVEFARAEGIVIMARSAHTAGVGTRIHAVAGGTRQQVKSITAETDVAILEGSAPAAPLASILAFLEELRIRGRTLHAGAGRTFLALPLQDVHGLGRFREQLQLRFDGAVQLRDDLGTVTAVGTGLDADWRPMQAALACAERIGASVHASWLSPLSVSLLVERTYLPELTRQLHGALVAPARDAA